MSHITGAKTTDWETIIFSESYDFSGSTMPGSELALPYLESGQYVIKKKNKVWKKSPSDLLRGYAFGHLDELQVFVICKDNCQLHCKRFLVAHIVIPFVMSWKAQFASSRLYPLCRSSLVKKHALCSCSNVEEARGSGYLYLTVMAFNPQWSIYTGTETPIFSQNKKRSWTKQVSCKSRWNFVSAAGTALERGWIFSQVGVEPGTRSIAQSHSGAWQCGERQGGERRA